MITFSNIMLALLATALLLLAHIVRTARWGLLFPSTYLTKRFNLLLGLGLGYAVNLVVPLRIGELLRIGFVHRRDGIRFSHVAATVFVERSVDLLAVSVILAVLRLHVGNAASFGWMTPAIMALSACVLLAITQSIRTSARLRKAVWRVGSVFNDRIRVEVADFWWSAAEIVGGRTLLRWRFLASSLVMWALYLAAYQVFSQAAGVEPVVILNALLNQPLNALWQNLPRGMDAATGLAAILFATLPILAIMVYGVLRHKNNVRVVLDVVRQRGKSGTGSPAALRKRFDALITYDYFLASLFTGTNSLVAGFGLDAVDDCIVHKFFKGGSDAITALVEVDERLLIRKFATGAAAEKLKVQADWLMQGSNNLPLVDVVGERQDRETYTYDMPLVTPANDFYEVIHTSPAVYSRRLLGSVVQRMSEFHRRGIETMAAPAVVNKYLSVKATSNARVILDFAKTMLPQSAFELNGRSYDFASWDRLFDPSWLDAQVKDRRAASIHGDLTIENIIVAPNYPLGFYIIDPNPENIFDSPLIDWAKLMQSLHLGYETLNQGMSCHVHDGVIRMAHVRSQAYADLHSMLETEARDRLGADALREIYFHEIVNYLRLTTYKIRQSPIRGLGFFACTTILLDRYTDQWG